MSTNADADALLHEIRSDADRTVRDLQEIVKRANAAIASLQDGQMVSPTITGAAAIFRGEAVDADARNARLTATIQAGWILGIPSADLLNALREGANGKGW